MCTYRHSKRVRERETEIDRDTERATQIYAVCIDHCYIDWVHPAWLSIMYTQYIYTYIYIDICLCDSSQSCDYIRHIQSRNVCLSIYLVFVLVLSFSLYLYIQKNIWGVLYSSMGLDVVVDLKTECWYIVRFMNLLLRFLRPGWSFWQPARSWCAKAYSTSAGCWPSNLQNQFMQVFW